ncbi:heterokaryon incompatibility protein domain-containing protein [Trichoderma sp. SZMC 28014]
MPPSWGFGSLWTEPDRFRYASSVGRTSIRLLRIKPAGILSLGRPKLELVCETFSLAKLPALDFFALSYTWGPADYRDPDFSAADKQQILINHGSFHVYPNLFDALCELRKFFRGYPVYVWIDAICINQDDLAERASQVDIMDRIYQNASCTLVWLGKPRHPDEEEAVNAIFRPILDIPETEIAEMARAYPAQPFLPTKPPQHYGLPGPEKAYLWAPAYYFFRRRWFDRAWVIQEVALSKKVLVLWGEKRIEWDAMQHIASFLCRASKLSQLLQQEAGDVDGAIDPIEKFYGLCLLRDQCQLREDAKGREHLKANVLRMTGDDRVRPASLVMALALRNRSFQATDARDKVFAFLGIVNQMLPVDSSADADRAAITPDYGTSGGAATVFARITARVILQTQSLVVTITQPDEPQSKQKDLPSWCPDLSISAGISGFMDIQPTFDAACNTRESPYRPPPIEIRDGCLGISAVILARITSLGVTNDGLRHDPIQSLAAHLLDQRPVYPFTGQGCVEAFWRTLVMDAVGVNSPAAWLSFAPREPFRAVVMTQLWKQYEAARKEGASLAEWRRGLKAVDELAAADPAGHMPTTADFEREFGAMGKLAALEATERTVAYSEEQRALQGNFRAKMEAFAHSIEESFANKRFAVSDQGHFVLVPQWTSNGDTVVIVDGCPCPLVIRPHDNDASRWIMVGPAYVHGIMYGGALSDKEQWQRIWIA